MLTAITKQPAETCRLVRPLPDSYLVGSQGHSGTMR